MRQDSYYLSPASLSENGTFCVEFHPPLKALFWRPVLGNADVVGSDSLEGKSREVTPHYAKCVAFSTYPLRSRHRGTTPPRPQTPGIFPPRGPRPVPRATGRNVRVGRCSSRGCPWEIPSVSEWGSSCWESRCRTCRLSRAC